MARDEMFGWKADTGRRGGQRRRCPQILLVREQATQAFQAAKIHSGRCRGPKSDRPRLGEARCSFHCVGEGGSRTEAASQLVTASPAPQTEELQTAPAN